MKNHTTLSPVRILRMKAQGYNHQTDAELSDLAFGNRFAYRFCTLLLAIGVATAHTTLLSVMMAIAFSTLFLPNHPFDYIYNHLLAPRMNKPQLPRRSNQLKFACGVATLWIGATIYLFSAGFSAAGYVMGGLLTGVAFLVATTDYCIPSAVYNALFQKKNPAASVKQSE